MVLSCNNTCFNKPNGLSIDHMGGQKSCMCSCSLHPDAPPCATAAFVCFASHTTGGQGLCLSSKLPSHGSQRSSYSLPPASCFTQPKVATIQLVPRQPAVESWHGRMCSMVAIDKPAVTRIQLILERPFPLWFSSMVLRPATELCKHPA